MLRLRGRLSIIMDGLHREVHIRVEVISLVVRFVQFILRLGQRQGSLVLLERERLRRLCSFARLSGPLPLGRHRKLGWLPKGRFKGVQLCPVKAGMILGGLQQRL